VCFLGDSPPEGAGEGTDPASRAAPSPGWLRNSSRRSSPQPQEPSAGTPYSLPYRDQAGAVFEALHLPAGMAEVKNTHND